MEKIFKGEIPFVRILVPLISGIAAAYFWPSQQGLKISELLLILFTLILSGLVIFYRSARVYNRRWVVGVALYAALFALSYYLTIEKSLRFNKDYFAAHTYQALVAQIASEPKSSGNIARFECDVKQGYAAKHFKPVRGKLLVAIQLDSLNMLNYSYGDVLLIPAIYNKTEPPKNPGEFDFRNYLANHSIYHQAFLQQDQVQVIERGQGNAMIMYALKLRQKLVKKFEQYIGDRDAASFASTLILGYKADLSKEVLSAYSKTGTMHVLSVSGMHVAIVFIVLGFLLKFLDRTKQLRLIRAIIIIPLIWFYALVTGFSPSVCRAALMLTLVVVGKAIHKNQNTYNQIAASAFFLLLYNPYFMLDVGFQLSYIAVLGLVYFYPKIYHSIYFRYKIADWIWSYVALSLAAQLATFPLSIYYFHQFPLYFLISNLFIVLPVTLIMYAGLVFMFLSWPVFLTPLGYLLKIMINFSNEGLFYIEKLPYSNLNGIWITYFENGLLYALIASLTFFLLNKQTKYLRSALLIMLLLVLSHAVKQIDIIRQKQVILYSVNKNTALGFFQGDQAFLVTDLDRQHKTFTFSIQPSLDRFGIRKIQYLVPDQRHDSNLLYTDGHFTQFENWKMLRWDERFNYKKFQKAIAVDLLLIQESPKIAIAELADHVKFNTLVIDGTNKEYLIQKWKKEADELGLTCYVLKKNKAYVAEVR